MKNLNQSVATSICILILASQAVMSADSEKTPASADKKNNAAKAKVTGIGGVFFKSKKNQKALNEWYRKNLGINFEPWGGAIFRWKDDKAEDGGVTVLHIVEPDSKMFSAGSAPFTINYRIDNMELMVAQLKANHVHIVKGPESAENGKFLSIMDPEGNRVELWEPKIWDDKNKGK